MGIFDAISGGAANTAYKNNLQTINTGLNQITTALGDNYGQANSYLLNQGLSALGTGYTGAGQLLATGYGNQRTDINQGAQVGQGQLGQFYGQAADAINSGYGNAINSLGQGRSDLLGQYGQARTDLNTNYGQARSDIGTNFGQARTDLGNQYAQTQGYLGQATAAYDPLINGSQGSFTRFQNAIGGNGAAGSDQATQDFRAAPGYQFQTDQALGAIQRSAAARGGLAGGNATADILKTATGLADQSYQQYVNNLQAGANFYQTGIQGRAAGLTNQGNASQAYGNALSSLDQNQGTALAGVSMNLGNALSGVDMGLGNALNSNDTTAANIYGQQGSALGSLYQNQGNQLLNSTTNLGTNLGQADANLGTGQSALSVGSGLNTLGVYGQVGSNLTNLGNQENAAIQNATNAYVKQNDQKAAAQTQASGNLLGMLGGIASSPVTGNILSGLGKLFG